MTRDEFGVGLAQLEVACRQPVDDATREVYFRALSQSTIADEWRAFVDAMLVALPWKWFPKLGELQAALTEWRQQQPRALPGRLEDRVVRSRAGFWRSPEEQQRVEATVRANPRAAGEGCMTYLRRVALAAHLMADDAAQPARRMAGSREPGEDDQ